MNTTINSRMMSTTDTLAGYRITSSLGVAEGFAVNFGMGFSANGQKEALSATLRDAIVDMVAAAEAQGANAIVGLRYLIPETPGERIAIAYGTAVTVEKISE